MKHVELQNLPSQGDLSSYLPRADQGNPSIPQVPAVAGSQQPMRAESPSLSQQMSQFSTRTPFNPTQVDVGQSYSSPGPSPAPSPALSSPAHSPVPRQQFRSQSLSPAPRGGGQNPSQGQEYHSLPVGYSAGYPQGHNPQYPAMSQGQLPAGYQGVPPQGQMPGPLSQAYAGQQTQQPVSMSSQPNTMESGQQFVQGDPRQMQQVHDPRLSGAGGTQSVQSPQQRTVDQQVPPTAQFHPSQSNTAGSQTQQNLGQVGQGLPTQGQGGYNQQMAQYYQNQRQNVSSQQPQQYGPGQQSQGVVNLSQQNQQQQQSQVTSDAQKMIPHQNPYVNQQLNGTEYPTNQNPPYKNVPLANQIDPNQEGRSSPANIHLGLPYASTHQSRPAQSISHGFDKFNTVNSGEQNLTYGHLAHDHHGYAPIQTGGIALQNTKWDAEFPRAQQTAPTVDKGMQDQRYHPGKYNYHSDVYEIVPAVFEHNLNTVHHSEI